MPLPHRPKASVPYVNVAPCRRSHLLLRFPLYLFLLPCRGILDLFHRLLALLPRNRLVHLLNRDRALLQAADEPRDLLHPTEEALRLFRVSADAAGGTEADEKPPTSGAGERHARACAHLRPGPRSKRPCICFSSSSVMARRHKGGAGRATSLRRGRTWLRIRTALARHVPRSLAPPERRHAHIDVTCAGLGGKGARGHAGACGACTSCTMRSSRRPASPKCQQYLSYRSAKVSDQRQVLPGERGHRRGAAVTPDATQCLTLCPHVRAVGQR